MASGDSRRSAKTKKISSSVSSNDDDYQYLCPHEPHVINSPTKINRNSSNQNVPNARFNANPLFEELVVHEETRKKVRTFSDDGPVAHSLPSVNYPVILPLSTEFTEPLSPIYSNADNQNAKSAKDESRKNLMSRANRSDRNIEDRANKSNRLVEKKQSEDRLIAQKMQEVKLQKKISGQIKKQQGYPITPNQTSGNNKSEVSQVNETFDQCVAYPSQNIGPQSLYPGDKSFYEVPESQSSKYLLSCIDSLRKRMCDMEHSQDDKNMIATSLNAQESSVSGHQHNGFELTRKKLKNKLVELVEKKMMNDELVRILPQLQEDTNMDSPDNSASVSKPSQRIPKVDTQPKPSRIETREGRRRNIHPGSSTKRDNVRKEINSSFPVRRHYEAEGRANEDPIAPNPGPPNPKNSGKPNVNLSRETFNKIKLIEDRGGYTEEMNEILHAYFNQDRIGMCFSENDLNLQLDEMLVTTTGEDEEYGEEGYEGGYEENQEDEENEQNASNENEEEAECSGGTQIRMIVSDLNDAETEEEQQVNSAVKMCERVDHLDLAVRKNEYLVHNLYRHLLDTNDKPGDLDAFFKNTKGLMQNFPTQYSDFEDEALARSSHGDNAIRSSGEGSFNVNRSCASVNAKFAEISQPVHASNRICSSIPNSSDNLHSLHLVKRNPSNIISSLPDNIQSSHYVQNSQRRENLQLTQQNITNIELHNRSLDRNLHKKDSSSRKKDNNLSDKMGRFRFQAARNSSSEEQDASKESLDSIPVQSSELNPSHIGETERKTILDILKREIRSDKVYERNQDIRNSSRFRTDLESNVNPNSAFLPVTAPMNVSNSQTFDDGHDSIQVPHRNHQINPRNYSESRPKVNASMRTPEVAHFPSEFYSSVPHQNDTAREQSFQQVPLNFIQQLQRQVDQIAELFQSPLQHGHPTTYQSSNQNINTFPPMQPMQIPCNSYYHQLLLSLTQCYHTMYMQQLEIQQLQHALHHGFSTDVYHSVNSLNAHSGSESVDIRPCNLATWSNPLSISTFSHDPPPPPPFSPTTLFNEYEPEHLKYYPPLQPEFGSSIPTVRQCNIRHSPPPSYEENQNSGETLNNQVPPRTRANNFLDNFRSYSRLNLLSASTNVKRNEAPQSQVNSSVNENSHYCQDDTTTDGSITENERPTRDPESPVLNAELQAFRNRSKKANSEPTASANVKYKVLENPKKSSLTNFNPDARNILPDRQTAHRETTIQQPVPHSPSINLIQLQGQEDSKLGNFSSILPTSTVSTSGAPEVPTSEFLVNLYKEAKLLTNDAERHNALKLIRDIVLSDKSESTQSKIRNDYIAFSSKEEPTSNEASGPSVESSVVESTNISDKPNYETTVNASSTENTSTWTSQIMPPQSVSPSKKPISTGAVRKKPKSLRTSYSDSSYIYTSYDSAMRESISEDVSRMYDADYSKYVANLCASEVKGLFQSFCNPSRDEIFTSKVCSTLNSFVISKVANQVKMPSKYYTSLYNALEMVTDCLCGKKFSDCEGQYADKISEVLHKSLNSFFSNGQLNLSDICILGDDDLPRVDNDFNEVDLCNATAEKTFPVQRASISSEAVSLSMQPILIENSNLDLPENRNDFQPICAISSVENEILRSECEIEAEIEVEAGAEADLAEADQSPGQQGNVTLGSFPAAIVNLDSEVFNTNSVAAAAGSFAVLNGMDYESISESHGAHHCPDTTNDQDVCPDDIPTKLCSNLEREAKEELQVCMSSTDDFKDEVSSSGGNCDPE